MKINIYKIKSIFIFLLIFTISLYLFSNQIQPDNQYIGMHSIDFNFRFFIFLIFNFFLINLLISPKNTISITFTNFYLLFVIMWFLIFFDLINVIEFSSYITLIIILSVPILLFKLFIPKLILFYYNINLSINRFNFLSFVDIKIILSIMLIIVFILVANKMPLDFNLITSYERRSLGSELLMGIYGYLFSICMNSIAPYLAFISMLRRKYLYFILSLIFVIFCFGFIGVKTPILYVCFFAFLGFFIRNKDFNFSYFALKLIFFILLFSIIEYWVFNFSWISDIIVRRAFVVVAQNQLYFIDYFLNYFTFDEWIMGKNSSITYIVGNFYYKTDINANVNALLYEIGRNGIFGYIFMLLFLLLFFSLLDYIYLKYDNKDVSGIAILYILLLLEQSYSTAFISSGICTITVLTFLTIKNKECNA